MIAILLFLLTTFTAAIASECNTRETEFGIICVCNSTYCDSTPDLKELSYGTYQIYTTSKQKLGHNTQTGSFSTDKDASSGVITIGKERYQKIAGFGGAFTDATGINIRSLPEEAQRRLLESYFGKSGNEYSLCRVPIGGTDFSPRPYSYDDVDGDETLENFKLQDEDFDNKIPFILEAKQLRNNSELKLFASAWTAPPWMKTEERWTGYSLLKDEYYQLWADYAVKFLDEYKKNGIEFWGITTGNEPMNGFIADTQLKLNAMGWVPVSQAKWVAENLGPTLEASSHEDVNIIINDDNRRLVPYYVPELLGDQKALKYIDGVGVHWYGDSEVPADVLELIHSDEKEIFSLMTEACFFVAGTSLGSWERAAGYIASIFEYLENGFVGWTDWNMVLNLDGGPTYVGYEADSPILVNASAGEFYKQPLFYAMGHFSKFIIPGSVRVDVNYSASEETGLSSIAFLRPDDLFALTIFNNGSSPINVQIENENLYSNTLELEPKSVSTVLFPASEAKENTF